MKTKLNKRTSLNIGSVLCLGLTVFFISYLLLRDDTIPLSINAILVHLNHSVRHWHVLVIGLLPVYVAAVIFAVTVIAVYLCSLLNRLFNPSK